MSDRYTDYDDFAWLYNRYWSKRLIDQIYWTIEKYLLAELAPQSRILDVACGNGHLAALMTSAGFEVVGIDGSEAMLSFARENAPEAKFIAQDARALDFDGEFDAVVSTCDSLNHVMRFEELERVFANVFRALRPGGRFSFDLNAEQGYRDYWKGETSGKIADDHVFLLKLSYDEAVRRSEFAVTLFRLIEEVWRRTDTRLAQQYYPVEDVMGALARAGFEDIRYFDTERDFKIAGTGRTMYVMRRPD